MRFPMPLPAIGGALLVLLLAACVDASPPPTASTDATPVTSTPASPSPTVAPTPTPVVPVAFPLPVVTGLTNLKAAISVDELETLAVNGELVLPCAVEIEPASLAASGECVAADEIAAFLTANPARVALLPPGLVEPATKVLRIAGDGPFGLFGPDLFGDPEARALDYPISGSAMPDDPALDPAWLTHDASQIWTLTNLGSLCADRGAAYETVAQGRGWPWAFDGGTASYAGPAVVDPPDAGPYYPVQPIETGNDGATSSILERSDVAIADHECPIIAQESWAPNLSSTSFAFSVPEELVPIWRDTLGLDMIYLAANHMSDKGEAGIQSTLELLDEYGVPRTGMGMTLDEALEPAYLEVAGITVGFVAFNDVVGVTAADAETPGVAWLTQANVDEAVGRARAGGADLVICSPQWWGGAEYHADLWPSQLEQLGWMDGAGCDHVIGSGTHVAGPLILERLEGDVRAVLASPGNYMFGQGWWQETQEGVILDMTFRGTELVNVRLHPTVQVLQARPALLDPEGDGHYVLERIWQYAQVNLAR
ncbi:MAG TPA: CapA family protein [Candidatus Limnocylindria bacterium]